MPDTPSENDDQQKEVLVSTEKVEPLKLEAINGFRARMKRILKKWGGIAVLSSVIGGYAGHKVQESYRGATGYNPNKPVPTATTPAKEKPIPTAGGDPDKPKRWRDRAKRWLKKAKEYAHKKFNNAKERSKLVKKYQEAKNELKKAYNGLLEFGDKTAFWGPFLMMFLATVILSNKVIEVKKRLTQNVDPAVEASLKSIEVKLNELIAAHNAGGTVSEEAVARLMEDFTQKNADIEGGIGDDV